MYFRTLLKYLTVRFYLSSLLIGISIFVICLAHPVPIAAQSSTSLNVEINQLRSQVKRLETEVGRLRRSINSSRNQSVPTSPTPSLETPPTTVEGQVIGSSDPMFQRLATLVIELKEDVRELQGNLQDVHKRLINLEASQGN